MQSVKGDAAHDRRANGGPNNLSPAITQRIATLLALECVLELLISEVALDGTQLVETGERACHSILARCMHEIVVLAVVATFEALRMRYGARWCLARNGWQV